jgi:hypothetical protein
MLRSWKQGHAVTGAATGTDKTKEGGGHGIIWITGHGVREAEGHIAVFGNIAVGFGQGGAGRVGASCEVEEEATRAVCDERGYQGIYEGGAE